MIGTVSHNRTLSPLFSGLGNITALDARATDVYVGRSYTALGVAMTALTVSRSVENKVGLIDIHRVNRYP